MATVFVFGSNKQGIHGAGAALHAKLKYGAKLALGLAGLEMLMLFRQKTSRLAIKDNYLLKKFLDM
jgi:hypothetical protein